MTTKTFAVSGPLAFHARVNHGSLTVEMRDDLAEASVTLVPRSGGSDVIDRITVELRGSVLAVVAPRQGGIFDLPIFAGRSCRERDAVDIAVVVPSGTTVKASSFTAEITVTGRCGTADIASAVGGIRLDDVDGELRLRYGNGTAAAQRVSGSVESRSGSGSLTLGSVAGSVNAACGSGRIEVGAVHGSVRTRAGSGEAQLNEVHGDVNVVSGSGGFSIGLPAGLRARLDVTTGSGRVSSDLPIEDAPSGDGTSITVRARTGSGNIRLFRAA